jgi:phosphatidylinositol-3-phosphatase
MRFEQRFLLAGSVLVVTRLLGCSSAAAAPLPPRYDQIVVVIEENHSAAQVMGSPYPSSLASRGHRFPTCMESFIQASQITLPSSAVPLRAWWMTSNTTFPLPTATYSEGLPSPESTMFTYGRHVRKHNPCASFTNVPGTSNLPFGSSPRQITPNSPR